MSYRKIPKVEGYTRKAVIAFFKIMLRTNPAWSYRALKKLYDFQTKREKITYVTKGTNNFGFDKIDGLLLVKLYEDVKKTGKITKSQLRFLQKRIEKYACQLASISDPIEIKISMDRFFKGK